MVLKQDDFNGAAAINKVTQEINEEIEMLLKIPDVLGAMKRLEEACAGVASDARAAEAEAAANAAEAEFQEKCKSLEADIQRLVQEQDYAGAAKCAQEKEALTEEAKDARLRLIPTPQRPGTRSNKGASIGRREEAEPITIADLQAPSTIIPKLVILESVRVLSFSKISSMPGNKGKGKNKQAPKGKSKGKSKDGVSQGQLKTKQASKGKGADAKDGKSSKTANSRQDSKWMYVGQDGYIIGIGAFGDDVQQLDESLQGSLIDVHALRPSVGQLGTIYWSEVSKITRRTEHTDGGSNVMKHHGNLLLNLNCLDYNRCLCCTTVEIVWEQYVS